MKQGVVSDTIAAISTPIGTGGIAVIRISGSAAITTVQNIFKASSGISLATMASHTVHHGTIAEGGHSIDEVMVTVFHAPRSYTGEHVVEISCHGGMVVTRAVLGAVLRAGARLAEPGEFTQRAFMNGKCDLAQVEAIIDLITAKTDASARAAVEHLEGRLSRTIKEFKERLIAYAAQCEAVIDFPEEEHELTRLPSFTTLGDEIDQRLKELMATYTHGELLRCGVHTVLIGRPNVGKSSLMNALLNRDRAIVSDVPGTTRDALEEVIDLEGVPFRLVDTAGIVAAPQHQLDFLSIAKTRQQYERGDLILFLVDGSCPLSNEDEDIARRIGEKPHLIVVTKSDLPCTCDRQRLAAWQRTARGVVELSTVTKQGMTELERMMVACADTGVRVSDELIIMRARQHDALERAHQCLERARRCWREHSPVELLACDVREAITALDAVIGEVCSNDILETIFRELCMGK